MISPTPTAANAATNTFAREVPAPATPLSASDLKPAVSGRTRTNSSPTSVTAGSPPCCAPVRSRSAGSIRWNPTSRSIAARFSSATFRRWLTSSSSAETSWGCGSLSHSSNRAAELVHVDARAELCEVLHLEGVGGVEVGTEGQPFRALAREDEAALEELLVVARPFEEPVGAAVGRPLARASM